MDQDLWFKALHFHGPVLLQTILSEDSDLKKEVETDKLNMCQFIKTKLHTLLKPCDYSSDALPEHSFPTIPIELFQNSSEVERRDLFFKSLDRGCILILRVINDALADNFKLLVLCREDNCMKLDDLSLIMYLPKLQAELDLAGGDLKSDELIRAAVCSCSIDERKLYVTLDSTVLEDDTENVHLGKILESDLPFYVGEVDVGLSYVEYLHHNAEFHNPAWSDELSSFLDIEQNYQYSFLSDWDGKKYDPIECASELKEKQSLTLSSAQHAKAVACYETAQFKDAFIYLNNALKIYPKNIEALISRATLYANTNDIRKAFVDMEEALKINPNHKRARKEMSVLLVSVARLNIEQNDIAKAQESLDAALNMDSNNKDAVAAIEEIRKKAAFGKMEKVSILDKKSRIGSSSSDRSDSSSSRKDKPEIYNLEAATKAFLTSLKKKHQHGKGKKGRHHHHAHHKSKSKSPKRKIDLPLP